MPLGPQLIHKHHSRQGVEMERMGTDGLPQPGPPNSLSCCSCQAWEDPLQREQHRAAGGKSRAAPQRQHRWRVDTGTCKAQDCTCREACLALQPLPAVGSPLALVGSQKPGGWWQAQGGLAGSPFRLPKKTYIGRVSLALHLLKMTFSKNLKHLDREVLEVMFRLA